MNRFPRLAWIGSGCALAVVPLLVAAQTEAPKAKPEPAKTMTEAPRAQTASAKITGKTLIAADELKWTPMTGIDGAQQAAVFGDPTKEPHRVFYKFPAGTKAPLHTHTYGDRGVIISGTLSLAVEGAPAKKLPPGSFFAMAGGTKHVTAVEGDAPCVFYVEREGPFDVVMAEEAGAKKK